MRRNIVSHSSAQVLSTGVREDLLLLGRVSGDVSWAVTYSYPELLLPKNEGKKPVPALQESSRPSVGSGWGTWCLPSRMENHICRT